MPVVMPSFASMATVNAVPSTRPVLPRHRLQPQLVAALASEAEANEASTVRDHEVDRFGGGELGGDRQVALVFPIRRVHDDDELARAEIGKRFVDGGEGRRHGQPPPTVAAARATVVAAAAGDGDAGATAEM